MLNAIRVAVKAMPETPINNLRSVRFDWIGQTAASLLWIASVFAYGITSAGDILQLAAATAWLLANVASLSQVGED